jgi:hypothetical protein
MSEIIQFPVIERVWTEADVDKIHAEAFREPELEVANLDLMGEIAQGLITECVGRDRKLERATFAVVKLASMLRDFKASYYKRWEPQP